MRLDRLAWLAFLMAWTTAASACADEVAAADAEAGVGIIYPNGLALDREGNLFVADVGRHQILKLDGEQRLTVIAGTGQPGFTGDGGPAVEARLNAPADIVFDAEGNLLVADTFNHRVRRIDGRGVITTVVGSGKGEYGNNPAAALEVALNNPQSIALDREGNLFIADAYNHVVRRVGRDGVTTTFAGTEAGLAGDKGAANKAQLNLPQAVAVAPDGAVYISDSANSRIRRVGSDGIIQTIAGSGPGSGEGGAGYGGDGGPADKAKLFSPTDLKFNAVGQLYVVDSGNNRVRMIVYGTIFSIAGNGKPGFGGDGGKATQAALHAPQKIAVAPDGTVYVADRVNRRVRKVERDGTITTVLAGPPPAGIFVDPAALPEK